MNDSDRTWFAERIADMMSTHRMKLTGKLELDGYWVALRKFPRELVDEITSDTTAWSNFAPRAFELGERAAAEQKRREPNPHLQLVDDEPHDEAAVRRVIAMTNQALAGKGAP